jgi:hypothetical protein
MANSFTYFYFVLRLANPTGDALQSGLSVDDLLDAADSYNARFRGLKQLLILKTESVKVHIVLALGELHGFAFKRNQSNFVAHISAFSNFLLNERKWSLLSNDYRRLFSFLQDPLVCSEADVQATLIACGYTKALAEQAKKSIQFVGPSEQAQYKWLLHAHHWLMMAQEYAERVQLATSGVAADVESEAGEPAVVRTPAETAAPDGSPADVAPAATPPTAGGATSGFRKPANVVNRQYQQVAAATNPAGAAALVEAEPVQVEAEPVQPEPALPDQPLPDQVLPWLVEPKHVESLEVDLPVLIESPSFEPTPLDPDTSAEASMIHAPAYTLSDEQMLAVLHSLLLTRSLGDEQAVARKEEAIAAIKATIAPWAYFG